MFVFFDIGDTLVDEADFARFRHASIYRFLLERGYTLSEEDYTTDLNNLSMRGRMTLFDQLKWWAGTVGGDTLLAMAAFREYTLHVAPEAPTRFVPFADARATLETLARSNNGTHAAYRLGIIANQPTWIRARMAEWGLLACFEPGCVIISDEVAVSKPQPEIFHYALHQAGVAAEDAMMVGNDYTHDILPAKRLGMRTVWIERDDPYSPGTPPIEDPWAADARVTQLAQVPAALARLARLAHGNGHDTKTGRADGFWRSRPSWTFTFYGGQRAGRAGWRVKAAPGWPLATEPACAGLDTRGVRSKRYTSIMAGARDGGLAREYCALRRRLGICRAAWHHSATSSRQQRVVAHPQGRIRPRRRRRRIARRSGPSLWRCQAGGGPRRG